MAGNDPAREVTLAPWRGWFRVRRAASGAGVELVTRIPGYLTEVTAHDGQDAAERAAAAIYDRYRADVTAITADCTTEQET